MANRLSNDILNLDNIEILKYKLNYDGFKQSV